MITSTIWRKDTKGGTALLLYTTNETNLVSTRAQKHCSPNQTPSFPRFSSSVYSLPPPLLNPVRPPLPHHNPPPGRQQPTAQRRRPSSKAQSGDVRPSGGAEERAGDGRTDKDGEGDEEEADTAAETVVVRERGEGGVGGNGRRAEGERCAGQYKLLMDGA